MFLVILGSTSFSHDIKQPQKPYQRCHSPVPINSQTLTLTTNGVCIQFLPVVVSLFLKPAVHPWDNPPVQLVLPPSTVDGDSSPSAGLLNPEDDEVEGLCGYELGHGKSRYFL